MKAKNLSGQAPGGKRTRLADALPLSTPYVVQIFPIYSCNFKCRYCIYPLDIKDRGFISDKISMDFELFKRSVDEMAMFPEKIKVLRFVGIGEPLLHKNLADMVEYAVEKKVANVVELLTNGSLLIPKITDRLIDAGLSRLVVSIQGTSAQKYEEICGVKINFTNLLANLKYFYEHKSNAHMYIKIIDCALDDDADEKRFYELFGNMCDTIAVEHTVPIHSGVDYGQLVRGKEMELTQFGLKVADVKICPQPFFTMQINPDGKVVPCYSFEYPEIVGDCNLKPANEIWTGTEFQRFRLKMLDGVRSTCRECAECSLIKYRLFPEDTLNDEAENLKEKYKI